MRKEAGVYALVMQLKVKQTMTIDKKRTQVTFLPGWYVYVGSACGAGGLKSRTDRHMKRHDEGKRMHWNVDYFREFASIREVWYSYTTNSRWEHDWARTIMKMHESTIPAFGFGANDCTRGCDAHFFHFPGRPFTVGFRSKLQEKYRDPPEVFVEVHDRADRRGKGKSDLLRLYDLGRRSLEQRRHAIGESELRPKSWQSLAKGKPGRVLMEHVAKEILVSFEELKAATQFSEAVDQLVLNCGDVAIQTLFDRQTPQSRSAIMRLSRTADTRQRHRIQGVQQGQFRSIAPQNNDHVFDTIARIIHGA